MQGDAPSENELLASLLDASVDGLLAFDRDCRYTAWNSAMERMSGLARAQVVGRNAFELFPFLKATGEDWYFHEALAGRAAVSKARPYLIPETGHRGLFDGHYAPARDREGRVVGGTAVIRDITDSHRAAEALRESEERYRAFIANSSEGVWRFELEEPVPVDLPADEQLERFYAHGYLAECNDAMARMYGFERPEEITGARLADLLVRDDPENVEYLRAFIAAGYRLTNAESVEVDREGRTRYFSNNLVGVVAGGRMLRAWGTQRDVTERRRMEDALRESEEKYRSLLENANDIIYSHDLAGNYLTINRACEEVTGYAREEILGGLNMAQVVVPEHFDLARRMMEQKLRDPSPTVYEIDIRTKDGRRLTLEVSTRVARRAGGEAVVEGIARDVTDRKRAEREREELLARERAARREAEEALAAARSVEESLGLLVEASGVLLGSPTLDEVQPAVLGVARRLIAADAYAVWRGDAAARTWRIASSAGLSEEYRAQVVEEAEPGAFRLEGPVVGEDVERLPVLESRRALYRSEGIRSLLAVPLRIHGETSGTLTYYYRRPHRFGERELRVATALANLAGAAIGGAELYDEQRRLRAEAEAANRLKDEFLATVSHELRTPLTAILGWAQMLRQGGADERTRGHALEVIERNAHAQRQIVEDILEVSRIITGKLRIDPQPVELMRVVEAAREAVEPAAGAKGVRIESSYEAESAPVLGDPDRLQQVVWNLLSNAVKFTPRGGRVSLSVARASASAVVSVSDTGEGIAPEFLPYVFERFRQADMGTTRQHGGLGLGLSIVRHLAEAHGGSVRAESDGRGRGATFTLTIPLRAAGEANAPAATRAQDASVRGASPQPPPSLAGLRLLVVEDEADTRTLLAVALGGYGAQVTTAASAAEALELFARARPHVLLSDIGMPGVDGYELLRRVRALGAGRGGDVPAVALTAYARTEDRALALGAGFQEHVAKPVDPTALARVISRLAGPA